MKRRKKFVPVPDFAASEAFRQNHRADDCLKEASSSILKESVSGVLWLSAGCPDVLMMDKHAELFPGRKPSK